MRRLVRLSLIASLLYGMGAHWSALQGAAWAGMIATRVSESSLADAVRTTISGEKPCHVCKIVDKAARPEQGPALLPARPPIHLLAVSVPEAIRSSSSRIDFVPSAARVLTRAIRPDSPPPKAVLHA
jgi:hypothetical protein